SESPYDRFSSVLGSLLIFHPRRKLRSSPDSSEHIVVVAQLIQQLSGRFDEHEFLDHCAAIIKVHQQWLGIDCELKRLFFLWLDLYAFDPFVCGGADFNIDRGLEE